MPPVKPPTAAQPRTFVGIDPGKKGAIVAITPLGLRLWHMPTTEEGILQVIGWLATNEGGRFPNATAVIEQVQGFIGREHPGATMFPFGMNYGGLRMAMLAVKLPFVAVAPLTWQRALGAPTGKRGEKRNKHKAALKTHALKLFPRDTGVITLETCDAMLLAEYNRRTSG